ncbi:MAG: flippase [Candidatus Bathyarchaeota archaeon]|nr:flippase [Candidatus Bathyarchaeota archaeon]
MSDEKTIIKGSFWVYAGNAASLIIAFLSTVILSRILDREDWGIFASVLSVSYFMGIFVDFGFTYTLTHYTSTLGTRGQYSKLKLYLNKLLRYRFILILVFAAGIFLASEWISEFFHVTDGAKYFQISALFFIFSSAFTTFDVILTGLKKFRVGAIFTFLDYALRLIIALIFIYFGFGVVGVILGYTAAFVFVTFLAIYALRGILFQTPSEEHYKVESMSEMFVFGGMMGIAQLAVMLMVWTDSLMIGAMMGATFVGVYKIAISISTSLGGAIGAINKVVFPVLVGIEAKEKESAADLNKILKYGSFFAIPAVFGIAFFSTELIILLFGQQYIDAAPALMILSYLCFDFFFSGSLISYFSAKKKVEIVGYAAIICSIGNIILNFILIPILGIVGANLGILIFEGKRKLGLEVSFENLKGPLFGSILMVLVLTLIKFFVIINSIFLLVLLVAIGAFVYFLFEAIIGINIFIFGMKVLRLLLEK